VNTLKASSREGRSDFTDITVTVAVLWSLSFVAFSGWQSLVTQLLSFLLSIGLLVFCAVSFVRIFTRWKRESWRSAIPFLVCVVAVFAAEVGGNSLRSFLFMRALPRYESVIREIETGTFPVKNGETVAIPRKEETGAYAIFAYRTNGVLAVEFLTGGGFPVKHSGYLYSSSGVVERGSIAQRRWPRRTKVRPLWFRISD
jgi:hypothetical protein